jgi:hypothetical protein
MNTDSKKTETEQCTIPSVSKRFIELTREDLVKFKSYLPIDKISCYDFKSSSITRDELHKAEKITFKDGEEIKILKSRPKCLLT